MPRKTARQTYKAVGQQAVKAGVVSQQAFNTSMASADQYSAADLRKATKKLKDAIKKSKKTAKRQSAKAKKQTAKKNKVTESLRKRAGRFMRAIKANKIAAKQGKSKPMDFTSIEGKRDQYEAFVALYKGVKIPRNTKSKKSKKRVSAKTAYQSIKAQSKKPYMLKKGYRIPYKVVGGGGKGAGIIKAIPGSKAIPFAKLSDAEQREVVAFLNSEEGKMLRGKGAPKTVSLQKIQAQAAKQKTRRQTVKSRKTNKGRKPASQQK